MEEALNTAIHVIICNKLTIGGGMEEALNTAMSCN